MKIIKRDVNPNKAYVMAIVTNGLQVALIVVIVAYILLMPQAVSTLPMARYVLAIAACVVIWGGVVDIREALATRKLMNQLDDMDHTIAAMESLNNTLRSQRHDFLNHLQVVYSLMEMEEYEEASAYIEKVYGAITSVSRTMKTANPAINALLQVKLAACEKAGIPVAVTALSDRAADIRNADLGKMAVVIGSEGRGVRPEVLDKADAELIIPMNPRCESLNAAIAAAIVMWQMK